MLRKVFSLMISMPSVTPPRRRQLSRQNLERPRGTHFRRHPHYRLAADSRRSPLGPPRLWAAPPAAGRAPAAARGAIARQRPSSALPDWRVALSPSSSVRGDPLSIPRRGLDRQAGRTGLFLVLRAARPAVGRGGAWRTVHQSGGGAS